MESGSVSELELVSRINAVVNKFKAEWETAKASFLYDTEADIHVELASRLKKELKEVGALTQEVFYKEYGWIEVSLLSCCYPVEFDENDPKQSFCRPDIQIFKRAPNPEQPPDAEKLKNWPALWVCEIKYKTELLGGQDKRCWHDDIQKLKRLKGVDHCYVLQLERDERGCKSARYDKVV